MLSNSLFQQCLRAAIVFFPMVISSSLNIYDTLEDDTQLPGDKENIKGSNVTRINNRFNGQNDGRYEDGTSEICRRFPMWTKSFEYDEDFDWMCRAAMKYDPPSVELLIEREEVRNLYYKLWAEYGRRCILDGIDQTRVIKTNDEENPIKQAKVEAIYNNSDGQPVMVVISNALSEEEALYMKQLSICAHVDDPDALQSRPFSAEDDADYVRGGNDVVFLQGYLQLFTPGLAARVQEITRLAWEQAGWGKLTEKSGEEKYQDPSLCGIRTTEHIGYDNWKSLGAHIDTDSLYSTVIALASPSEYDGGEFYLYPDRRDLNDVLQNDTRVEIRAERLSAVIFLSETLHGVGDIRSKGREMFATEFWKYNDAFLGTFRPGPPGTDDQ